MSYTARTLRRNSKELKTILADLDNYETIVPEVIGGVSRCDWLLENLKKGCSYSFMIDGEGNLIVTSGYKDTILRKRAVVESIRAVEVVEEMSEFNAKKEAIKEMFMEEYGVALRFVDITADKIRVGMHGLDIGIFRKMRFIGGSIETDKSGCCVIQVNAGNLRLN